MNKSKIKIYITLFPGYRPNNKPLHWPAGPSFPMYIKPNFF